MTRTTTTANDRRCLACGEVIERGRRTACCSPACRARLSRMPLNETIKGRFCELKVRIVELELLLTATDRGDVRLPQRQSPTSQLSRSRNGKRDGTS